MSDKEPKVRMDLSGLAEAGKSVARAPEKSETRFEHLRGVKVGQHVPEESEQGISFESLDGQQIGQFKPDAPEKSVETETDAH